MNSWVTVEDRWGARGGMWCKGDWHRNLLLVWTHGFLSLQTGPLQMQELLLYSLLQMDNQCTPVQGFSPSLITHCSYSYQRSERVIGAIGSPHHSRSGERGTCAVLPLHFQGSAWNSAMDNLISTWAADFKRQQTSTAALPWPAPTPPLASLCHQVPTDHTSAIRKALQKIKIWKFCCLKNQS